MFEKVVDFIRQLYGPEERIPLHAPNFLGNEKKYLDDCIDTGYVSSIGNYVNKFEENLASFTGANYAVACVNGTCALHLALKIAGVLPDDEVITQALTFVATGNAISYVGAHPVFIDVDSDTMGLSPEFMEEWLRKNSEMRGGFCCNKKTLRRIKACLPMHTFGHPVKLTELAELCIQYNIDLIEDAAESIGSYYKNRHTGIFGKVGVISFNGNKIVTTGGGGVLLFNDQELAKMAKHLTTQAKVAHPWEFFHDDFGYNYRMPNVNAALGCAQMENISHVLENKRTTAGLYRDFFSGFEEIEFISEPVNCVSNYWLNAIKLKDFKSRLLFLEYTHERGIMTRPPWTPLNELPMFKKSQTDKLKNTWHLYETVVNLPSSYRK